MVPNHEDAIAFASVIQDMAQQVEHALTAQQTTATELQTAKIGEAAAIQVAAANINEATAARQQYQQAQAEHAVTVTNMALNHAAELARSGTQANQITDAVVKAIAKAQELPKVRFSELVKAYEESRRTSIKASSMRQYLTAADAFVETMGDMFICDISRRTMREFLDIEKEMPPNKNGVNSRFRSLSRREAVELNRKEDGETVVFRTLFLLVSNVQAFFTWGLENSENPEKWGFTGYGSPCRKLKENILTADEREMLEKTTRTRRDFSNEDLTRLFNGKVRTIEGRFYGYGVKRFQKRHFYWLPLLALFTGARANELAQLRLSDIVEEDGIACISINTAEDIDGQKRKRTKTTVTSVRLIPIHSDLIELGFLDYVGELRAARHLFLFQEMNPQDVTNETRTYGAEMVKWFIGYRRACDVVENEKGKAVFHSFRHTMASRLLSASVPEYMVNGIMGHAQSTMTTRQYMQLEISTLKQAIENMKIPRDVFSLIPKWEIVNPRFLSKLPSPAKMTEAPAKKKREMR